MYRGLCLFGVLFLFTANTGIYADDQRAIDILPGLRERALIMDINARVLEDNQIVIWDETHQRITISGAPVGIRLVGSNVAVLVQFTPFIRSRRGNTLVAQGQVWIEVPNEGIRYFTSLQTVAIEFNEPIFFFPLGSNAQEDGPVIEIMLTMKPLEQSGVPSAATEGNER